MDHSIGGKFLQVDDDLLPDILGPQIGRAGPDGGIGKGAIRKTFEKGRATLINNNAFQVIEFGIEQDRFVFVSGANLTNRPQVSYTGSKEFPEDISYNGRKYTFGIDYKF